MYLTIPVLFYACEGLIRKLHEKSYCVAIIKVRLLLSIFKEQWKNISEPNQGYFPLVFQGATQAAIYPGTVLSIHVKKPPGFKCKSGMYLFIKYPDVTPFEWYVTSFTGNITNITLFIF